MYIGQMATWVDAETIAEDGRPKEILNSILEWGMVVEPSEDDCFAAWEEELYDQTGPAKWDFKDGVVYADGVSIGCYKIRRVKFKLD